MFETDTEYSSITRPVLGRFGSLVVDLSMISSCPVGEIRHQQNSLVLHWDVKCRYSLCPEKAEAFAIICC